MPLRFAAWHRKCSQHKKIIHPGHAGWSSSTLCCCRHINRSNSCSRVVEATAAAVVVADTAVIMVWARALRPTGAMAHERYVRNQRLFFGAPANGCSSKCTLLCASTFYYLRSPTHYSLSTIHYTLPTTYYLLPTAYYLLPTAYYLLPTTYYLLPTTTTTITTITTNYYYYYYYYYQYYHY